MSSTAAGSSASFVLTMGYIDAWNGNTNLCATTNSEDYPSVTITMKAQTLINQVVLVPPIEHGAFEQLVEVYIDSYSGGSVKCGTDSLPSIFTNFEFSCPSTLGYQVRVKSKNTASVLKLCSVGVMSSCDCTQTSLLEEEMPDFGARIASTAVTANYMGAAVTV